VSEHHHDHMICVKCGKITEFEDHRIEEIQEEIASSLGFRVVTHKHEIYVVCPEGGCDT